MALMRYHIDQRTFNGLTATDTITFPHLLQGAPHHVFIRYIASLTNNFSVATNDWWGGIALVDNANVTIQNPGTVPGPDFEVTSILFHSIVE